jgi:hypothetical protein
MDMLLLILILAVLVLGSSWVLAHAGENWRR